MRGSMTQRYRSYLAACVLTPKDAAVEAAVLQQHLDVARQDAREAAARSRKYSWTPWAHTFRVSHMRQLNHVAWWTRRLRVFQAHVG
jgi:hypothetical protein